MAATEAEIVVNVRLLPEETPTHSHLTRFQRGRLGEVTGPTLRLKCRPSDTVATLKKMILSTSPHTPPPSPSSLFLFLPASLALFLDIRVDAAVAISRTRLAPRKLSDSVA